MKPPSVHAVAHDGAVLNIRCWRRSGEPLIMLSGGPGMPDYFGPVVGLLNGDLRVITYDQRGTGASSCNGGTFNADRHVTDLEAICRRMGIDRFHLFGHSWGGLLAQLYAHEYPHRLKSLFLCNAMTGIGKDFVRMGLHLLMHYHMAAGAAGMLKMDCGFLLLTLPGRIKDAGARMLYKQIWCNFFAYNGTKPRINAHWLRGVQGRSVQKTTASLFRARHWKLDPARLTPEVPVMALYGAQDVFGPTYRTVFNRYPWARKTRLPRCGHVPWFQNPLAFAAVLRNFYGSIAGQ